MYVNSMFLQASAFSRNYSMVLTGSGTSHEFDFEDDDDDEEDDVTDGMYFVHQPNKFLQ